MNWIKEKVAQYQLWRQQRGEVSLYDGVYVHQEEPELMDSREDVELTHEPDRESPELMRHYARFHSHRAPSEVALYDAVADGWGFDPLEGVEIGALAYVSWSFPEDLMEWDGVAWPAIDEGADA